MDYTYRERRGEAIYRFENRMLPSDFFRRNVVLSFQEDAIGIRLRDRPRQHGVGQYDEGLGLSAQRVDLSSIAEDPCGDPGGRARRRISQDRRRQHRPRVQV
jgi:hypothetical protein